MDGGEGHSWIFSFWGLHGPEQRRDTGLDSTESLAVADRVVQGTIHRDLIEAFTGNALYRILPLYTRYIISHYDICYPTIGFHGTRRSGIPHRRSQLSG